MRKATSQDIERIREKTFELYPNKSVSNFGFIYVEDRWIMGLIVDGIRYVGEANTPQDAHEALKIDLKRFEKYTAALERLDDALEE